MRYYAAQILRIAEELQDPSWICNGWIMTGTSFADEDIDSSYYYYRKSLALAEVQHLPERQAYSLYCIGWLNQFVGNYRHSILYLDSAINLATPHHDDVTLFNAWNTKGMILTELGDSEGAVTAYRQALQAALASNRKDFEITVRGNLINQTISDTLRRRMAYLGLVAGLKKIPTGNEQELASLYNNLSYLYADPDSAMKYLLMAQELITGTTDASILASIHNSLAYAYLDKGDLRMAEICLRDEAIPLLIKVNNQDLLSTLYDSYGDILKAAGRFAEAIALKEKSIVARGLADQKNAGAQVRLLNAMLDLKNKEREIMVQQEKVRNFRQNLIIAGSIIAALVMMIVWLIQRHRARLQREQFLSAKKFIELEENEKDRTASDLHDITGEFILSISNEIEKTAFPDDETREKLIDKVEEVGEGLRQISHRLKKSMVEHMGFRELIAGYCSDFNRVSELPIELEFPEEEFTISGEILLHIYRIVQELLANAAKHAHGGMVLLTFTLSGKQLRMTYRDTGPGFSMQQGRGDGMGFQNIMERVKLLGGKARVDSSPGNGVEWNIEIPMGK